ncbi:hypothetical protein [Chamaesiphon polymorphus]|uniref:hypothetical protein n=1 Tax=Chamaesiphon polymorphus TaxID=2107691 RepID=UPI0011B2200B|nr:hypothetical protein [Chamaesiphon polymorphus]
MSTGLGPTLAKCHHCKTVFNSGKREWFQMSVFDKSLFWVLSIVYAIVIGASCGLMASYIPRTIKYGVISNWPSQKPIFFESVFVLSFIAFILYVQFKRIQNSKLRFGKNQIKSVAVLTSFFNFDFNLQVQFCSLFVALLCIEGLLLIFANIRA